MDRKLATIQKIIDINPIDGADAIEQANILGWHVVVKKSEFKAGDLCVYCEIDSILPESNPAFAFLQGKKLKTKKLRGVVSQGIVFSLDVLAGVRMHNDTREHPVYTWKEGMDVTNLLGITKWEYVVPSYLTGVQKGPFPSFIPKTDEMRIQAYPRVLQRHKDVACYVTEKVDGSSVTIYLNQDVYGVCSRNIELVDGPGQAHWIAAKNMGIEALLRQFGHNIALQGELLGPGIQGNKYALSAYTIMFYGAYDIDSAKYFDFTDLHALLQYFGLPMVPVLMLNTIFGIHDTDGWVEKAQAKSLVNPKIEREGIVIRASTETADIDLGRLSVKAVNPRFLLKYEDS